jgi:serine/threonine protein kinase
VIHRDLKPENVLILRHAVGREQIKILDFGLARLSQLDPSNPEGLTAPGMVMGTFAYMSPEQVSGQEVDERGDIFALGVMVVEALTGSRPFVGRTSAELIASFHLEGEAAEVKQLDSVLQKCLAKDRTWRFASVTAMQEALIPAIRQCPPLASMPASPGDLRSRDEATRTFLTP